MQSLIPHEPLALPLPSIMIIQHRGERETGRLVRHHHPDPSSSLMDKLDKSLDDLIGDSGGRGGGGGGRRRGGGGGSRGGRGGGNRRKC